LLLVPRVVSGTIEALKQLIRDLAGTLIKDG